MAQKSTTRPADDPAMPLHAAESALGSVKADLEHTHRLATLGLMAAGVAHEINNILTPVLAYAQLASSNPADSALQAKALDKAIRGVETATRITQAMLGFAGAAPRGGESQSASISQVLRSTLDCMGRDPAKDRIRMAVKIHPDASVRIPPLALQQVLLNVILNACSAMRKRGGDLSLTAIERSDGTTQITIADTGPGIPEDIAGRLFQPFCSARHSCGRHESAESTSGGTGLGLTICRRLIEDAGGSISVHSVTGTGTTVSITLPTAQCERAIAG
jgi:two-component system NtrC family sensor kinase